MTGKTKSKEVKKEVEHKAIWPSIIVLVIAVIIVAGVLSFKKTDGGDDYYAVYMTTGDIYFGKLDYFPRLALEDAYLLRLTSDEKNPIKIEKFSDSIWQPEDKVYLNDEQIVWKAKVNEKSQLLEWFRNQKKATNNLEVKDVSEEK